MSQNHTDADNDAKQDGQQSSGVASQRRDASFTLACWRFVLRNLHGSWSTGGSASAGQTLLQCLCVCLGFMKTLLSAFPIRSRAATVPLL